MQDKSSRKVRDPPGGLSSNARGFTMGRGRLMAPPAPPAEVPVAQQPTLHRAKAGSVGSSYKESFWLINKTDS